ncbi:MAG: TlpA disulfide reductase family protein [Bacteroidota bacterium]
MKLIFSLVLIITWTSCQQHLQKEIEKKETFSLSGTITGNYSDWIYLNYEGKKDSVQVIDQSFQFSGRVERPFQGWLNLIPEANVARLFIENSNISIQANYKQVIQDGKSLNILNIEKVEGSYSADILESYQAFYQENKAKENFQDLLFHKLDTFIEKNNSHPLSGRILGELAYLEPILNPSQLVQLFNKLDTSTQQKNDLEMFKQGISNLEKFRWHQSFPNVKLPNTEGVLVDILPSEGNITLLDFWASWCKPCREKHPALVELKKKYISDQFNIVSISIDLVPANWLAAIKNDQLAWTNLHDPDKSLFDQLGIAGLPFNYLVDAEGSIIGINLSIEQIQTQGEKQLSINR